MVAKQSPWPNADAATGMVRAERYFYDGVRRIQELWIDPIEAVPLVGTDDGEPLTMEELGEGLRGSWQPSEAPCPAGVSSCWCFAARCETNQWAEPD